jgi:hypothetical protein
MKARAFVYPSSDGCSYLQVGQLTGMQVPVEQLDSLVLACTLKAVRILLMFVLPHFWHFNSAFSEVTPTSRSNCSSQSLQRYE